MKNKAFFFSLTAISLLISACEKEDKPYTLPPPGPAKLDQVNMGSNYSKVIFYNLEDNSTEVRQIGDWDIALEAGQDGRFSLINGGTGIQLWRTGSTDFAAVPDISAAKWTWDSPSMDLDSTAIGEWASPAFVCSEEVMVIDRGEGKTNRYKKFQLLSVNDSQYTIRSANTDGSLDIVFTVAKDETRSFVYASLDKGATPDYEPEKDSWDFMFIRYRFIYFHMTPQVPYEVNGVILNPNNVSVTDERQKTFEEIDYDYALTLNYTNRRDFIGFDWKTYDFDKEAYITDIKRIFIIRSNAGIYYKLRFVDFYDAQGVKGAPSFEVQRL